MSLTHFGLILDGSEEDNIISKNNFSILSDETIKKYPHYLKVYDRRQNDNLLIYSLNMEFFRTINKENFNDYLDEFVKKYNLDEIKNLKDLKYVSGVYIMVLDQYRQIYIGQSADICNRIKLHWKRQVEFYKINQWGCYRSKIAVDSFKALDTTRIFAYKCEKKELNNLESKFINEYKKEYLCNLLSPDESRIDYSKGQIIRSFKN